MEILKKETLVDLRLLSCEHGMNMATKTQKEQISHASQNYVLSHLLYPNRCLEEFVPWQTIMVLLLNTMLRITDDNTIPAVEQ